MRRLPALAFLLLIASPATAQTPLPATSTNASSTITGTNTFQLLFAASAQRRGCTIQNNGSHTMFVTEGIGVAASTLTNSAQVPAGQSYYCQWQGLSLVGEIDITGTAGDAFYAASE